MTNNNHPITPPLELVQQWWTEFERADFDDDSLVFIATEAARWGADQELEACEKYWMTHGISPEGVVRMRQHRRPKPPSLKAQALEAVDALDGFKGVDIIRLALESLPE